jgi:hypothetical protein
MVARKTAKKGVRKGSTKKLTRKGTAKKSGRKTAAKKLGRKTATKKATPKTAAKKAARKNPAKKQNRTVAAKKIVRASAPKKQVRDPLAKAIAVHAAAQKDLSAAIKAYDRAVMVEARAAERLSEVKERIALKAMKGRKFKLADAKQELVESDIMDQPQAEFLIVEADIIETEVFEFPPTEDTDT